MAGKQKKEGPTVVGIGKDGREILDRFESDWDGVPNFKLTPPLDLKRAEKAKKPAAKKPKKK